MASTASMGSPAQNRLSAIISASGERASPTQWYVHTGTAPEGPYTLAELRELLRLSRIDEATSINRVGTESWGALRDDPTLRPYVVAPPATAPIAGSGGSTYQSPLKRVVVDQTVDMSEILRQHGAGHIGRPAGFWIRVFAYMIDSFIVSFLAKIAELAAIGVVGPSASAHSLGALMPLLFYYLATMAYVTMMLTGGWQATVGKRMLGIYVRRVDGHRITVAQSIGRQFAQSLSALALMLGYFMIGWNSEKKGLHDMMAGTRVVFGKL